MTNPTRATSVLPAIGVGAVIWNDKNEIVLIKRGKAPRRDQWSIPGGHLVSGETLHEAIKREVHEETNLIIDVEGLIDVVDLIERNDAGEVARHYVLIDFAARVVSGELRAGSDAAEARWVPFSQLNEYSLWIETRRVIEESGRVLNR